MFIRYLILLVVLGLVACAGPNDKDPNKEPALDEFETCDIQFLKLKICADVIWERKPTETELGSFVLEFYNPKDDSQLKDPQGALSVVLWMPSTEQGGVPVTVERLEIGQYRVSKVSFPKHGDWEIQLKLLEDRNILDQAAYPIHF